MTKRLNAQHKNSKIGKDKKPSFWKWFLLFIFISLLLGLAIFANSSFGIAQLDAYHSIPLMINEMGIWGQLVIIGLMIVHCFIPFPAELVALAAGSIYGTLHGTLLTWIGAMIGASLSFGLTRILGHPFVDWALPKKQRVMLDKWTEDQGTITLLISRFIPLIAFNLINYAAGLTKISWWTFLWTTGLGILPLTALMVHMGAQMQEFSWPTLIAVSLICISMMGTLHYYKRRSDNK